MPSPHSPAPWCNMRSTAASRRRISPGARAVRSGALGGVRGVYGVFKGVLGVYMVAYTCITGMHRCKYGNEGVLGCIQGIHIMGFTYRQR